MTDVMTPSKAITKGQAGKFVDVAVDALIKSGLPSEPTQKVLEAHGATLADEFVSSVRKRVEALQVLTHRGRTQLVISRNHTPRDYYEDRKGLWVYNGFHDLVISKADKTAIGAHFEVDFYSLGQVADDAQIEAALPAAHLFNETDLCAIISEMIELQKSGKEGALLNNGYANIFYTFSCVVRVYWSAGRGAWSVSAWERGDSGWNAGRRVFSPVTAA